MKSCKEIFNSTFKIIDNKDQGSESNQNAINFGTSVSNLIKKISKSHLEWINESWVGFEADNPGEKVIFYKFLKQITTCVLRVMEHELKLELKLRFSKDRDEIFMTIQVLGRKPTSSSRFNGLLCTAHRRRLRRTI